MILQGTEMKSNYNIRSYLNLQEGKLEQNKYFYHFGGSDPSRSLTIQLTMQQLLLFGTELKHPSI